MTSPDASREVRLAALAANRALLTLGAVAAAVGALAAASPARPAPEHRAPAPQGDVDHVLRTAGGRGPALRVWTVNPAFTAGDPGAEPLLPAFEWVAPVGPPGAPHGIVTATQDGAGHLAVTAHDDDALARALSGVSPDEVVVRDGARWLAVHEDRVRSLVGPPFGDDLGPTTVADLGRSRRDEVRAPDDEPVGG